MSGIKFRYWDMVRKEFITDCDVYFVAEDIIFAGDLNNLPLVDVTGQVQMSQYTGLIDKNSKEIYEGDIIEYEDSICDGYRTYPVTRRKEVTFGIGIYWAGKYELYRVRIKGEIIGNIYENPELISA
jgi:uncharacterized phage protein (TIGR01671 family)